MTRRLISSGVPLESVAGYSRAVVDGDFVFVAGTTGYDYATMIMPDSVEEQARNCLRTIARVLDEAGFALADVVRARREATKQSRSTLRPGLLRLSLAMTAAPRSVTRIQLSC
jgi:hypothetical protein